MSTILAYTSPARGHLYPLMPTLLELRSRGHEVVIRTLASEVGMLQAMGFAAEAIDPGIEAIELGDYRGRTAPQRLALSTRSFARRAPMDGADLRAALDAVSPDLLIVDTNSWGAQAAAELWGGPWALFQPYPVTLASPDVPPFGPGLPPAKGVAGRVRDQVLRQVLGRALTRAFLPPLNEVRTQMGAPALPDVDAMTTTAPRVLYFTAEPFEYPRSDWPASVTMVGPCPWEPPAPTPQWLEDVCEPLVLVTTSSEFQDDGRLARVAMAALADEDCGVFVTMPAADRPEPATVPPNARVVPFVAHAAVLARTSVMVTHGGMGATQKALAHGVPVVAVPFGRDQLEVARRVEVAGAGVRLPARRLSPERLRAAVAEARGMLAGAARVAAGYRAAGGARKAADVLEADLAGKRSGRAA